MPYTIETHRPPNPNYDDSLASDSYAVTTLEAVASTLPQLDESALTALEQFESLAWQEGDKSYEVAWCPRSILAREAGLTDREAAWMTLALVVSHYNFAKAGL